MKKKDDHYYGAHSVPKPFNKLNHLAIKINQFSIFNKITLSFMIYNKLFLHFKISCFYDLK